MEKNIEILKKLQFLRIETGRAHLFYSLNKLVNKFSKQIKIENVFIERNYLDYLLERMLIKDKKEIFFESEEKYLSLALLEEKTLKLDKSIIKEIQEDFLEIKDLNSVVFKKVKERLIELLENDDNLTREDVQLFKDYLKNWERLENKVKKFIPIDKNKYQTKNNYFYTIIKNYAKFFDKYNILFEEIMGYLKDI